MKSGDLPGTSRSGSPPELPAPATVQQRSAAVLVFYQLQADTHGGAIPYHRLLPTRGRRRGRYIGSLTGIGDQAPEEPTPRYRVRSGQRVAPHCYRRNR